MADVVTPAVRSKMMAAILGKNTKPEIAIRKALFERGFRYRLHDRKVPGTPDIVLPRYNAVIFVHGCFWHGHKCPLFKVPETRSEFWKTKIERNQRNDEANIKALLALDWRVAIVWECALKGRGKQSLTNLADSLDGWLKSSKPKLELRGQPLH